MAEKLISKRQAGRGHTFDLIREKQAAQAERDAAVNEAAINEFATALQSAGAAATSGPAAVSGPAQVQQQSTPQPMTGGQLERYAMSGAVAQAIQTPELDSFRGNVRPTGETWEDTNALARQADEARAAREAQVRRITDDWSGDAAMYLQSGGEVDTNTVRGLENIQRRYLGDMAGGVRNVINEAGYLSQGSMGGMQNDPALSGDAAMYMQAFGDNIPKVEDLKRITDFGQNFQNETQQMYGDMTGGWKVAGDLAGTVGQMTPAMALNLIPGAGSALSSAYLFGSAAGGATEEAAANGADAYRAMQYGVASGAVEAATEKLFDGLGGLLGKGAADDIVEGVIGRLTRGSGSNALRNAMRLGFGALGEGAEEGIGALVNPILQSIYNNKTVQENYKDLDWGDVGYQIMLGALSGGVLGSLGMVNGQFRGKNAELDQRVVNEVVNDVLTNTPEGQAVAARAQEVVSAETTPMRVEPAPADAEGTRLSASVSTVQNAPSTSPEFSAIIDKTVSENGYRYIPITNNETVQKATQRIQREGWERTRANWTADVRQGKTSAEMMAVGALLYNNAVQSGDFKAAAEIMADYVAAGTNTAQALQARKIIQSMQPEMRLYMIDSTIARLSENLAKKLPDGINISQELRDEYMRATTDEQRDEIVARMQKEVADQIPSTFKDKWTALRYVNMLGNFRTQARNILGNTTMAAITSAKNAVQTMFESVASAVTGGRVQRTTSLFADRDLVQAAREYYNANSDAINGEGKYSDNRTATGFMKGVEDQRRIFKTGIMEGYRRATNWAMTRGDTVFIGARFARTLAGYLQVNGMDAATFSGIQNGSIEATAEQRALIDKAVNYATQEAQEATFHDNNTLSTWISQIGRKPGTPKFARLLSEGIMPFRKTPANVLIRAEEYSPLGFVNATVKAVQAAKGTNNVTANDVVNSLSKAFTGTGIFFLGMLLRNAGWLTGHEDDDKQKGFNDLQGEQEYALNLPGGKSITIDWMSPASVPLFLGVQMMDAVNDGGFELKDLEKVFTSITDPMIQMSMLQGVNDTLSNVKYAENNLVQVGLSSALSYLTQGLTNTMLGQLERAVEDRRTTTYVDKDSNLPAWAQRAIGKAAEKVPIKGADFQQVEYLDAWGRPDMYEENGFARAINNFVNPGYVSQTNSTEVDAELQRLYDAGMGNVFPQRISMSDKIAVYDEHGQKTGERQLTADEYVQVQREAGQTKLRMVKDLMASPVYDGMSDEARADAISEIYKYANYEAIRKVEPSHEDKNAEIASLSNIPAYFAAKEAYQDATANRWNRDYEELDNVLDSFDALAPDVQKTLLEKDPQLRRVRDAYDAGMSTENWFKAYDATRDLTPYGDNKSVADWQKYQAMANVSSDKDMDVMLRGYMQDSAYESYMTARNDGLSAKDWADARAAAGMLTPPEGKEDVPDALQYQAMAQVLDDDGMDAMMHATLEDGSYDKYVAARDAGISAENWANAMASTAGLVPLEGHKDVTDAQKWQAMAGTVSDRDMDALMRANLSEGALRDYTDARNAGISARLWADTRAAVEQLPVLEGRSKIADFQAAYYIGSNSDLSNKEKDALMGLYLTKGENGKMSTYEKYMACRGAGFAPQHLAKFLEFKTTAGKKDDVIAAAMRYGFSEKNALALWNMFQSGHW